LTVKAGQGARFDAGDFYATAHPDNAVPSIENSEIVYVSSVVGDVFTIERGVRDSTAKNIAVGWRISHSFYAEDIEAIEADVAALETGKQPVGDYLTITEAIVLYEPKKGANDNYVTDAEKVLLGNTSGVNTGDQDLSSYETSTQLNARDTANRSRLNHTGEQAISTVIGLQSALDAKASEASLATHTTDTNNPHDVTKAQVGLSNADDTSDIDKPISTATQVELNKKLNKAGDTMTGDLTLESSYPSDDINGGTDGTSRLNLYSYQRGNFNSYGENIRHFLMRKDAKSMDTWYFPSGGYDANRVPVGTMKPVVWAGAHWEANDHNSNHKHWSVEVPDSTGAIQTRFEIRFGDPTIDNAIAGLDKTLIMTNLADFVVRTSNGQMLRLSSPAGNHKPIEFNHDSGGSSASRRWTLRANSTAETGLNTGTDFQLVRYDDNGTFLDSPIFVQRSTGNVGIGTITTTERLTIAGGVYLNGALNMDNSNTDAIFTITSTADTSINNRFKIRHFAKNSAGFSREAMQIQSRLADTTAGSERSQFVVQGYVGGTFQTVFNIDGGTTFYYGRVRPFNTNTTDLGATTAYWANIYANRYYLNSTAYIDGATAGTVNVNGALGILATSGAATHSLTLGSASTGIALYETTDQTTNYSRMLTWYNPNTNAFTIATQNAGSGAQRTMRLQTALGTILDIRGDNISGAFAFSKTVSLNNGAVVGVNGGLVNGSSLGIGLYVGTSINQSGSAGYTALLINPTETATGTGLKTLIDAQVGGVSKFKVDNAGYVTAPRMYFNSTAYLDGGTTGQLAVIGRLNASDIGGTNGTRVLSLSGVTSGVNYLDISNSAAGLAPLIQPAGTDANIDILIKPKGTGAIKIQSGINGFSVANFVGAASAVNYLYIQNAATGNRPLVQASGTDTNISLELRGKGTGTVLSPGDFEVSDTTKGVILKSPDGTRYRITVANGGTLNTAVA
jgi:hypothetical protein